ncbi:MAG: LptF/LptG family permease [Bacteroidota bacterium]
MKRLDKLLATSFIPPFIMTFFIALFVLIMQFLWKYIDDIVGKGLEMIYIVELIFYRSTALIPMALPVAVLISSVMVMGNLAERFELASIKSAGIPLLRVMRPLLFLVSFIAVLSWLSSNYLIPYSNLQFKSRLYDIRRQKPTLSINEGSFNDDFGGTVIRIGNKLDDNRTLEDILIYDHSENRGNVSQIIAKKGEMYTTPDEQYLVMRLYNGQQYQELKPTDRTRLDRYEHFHTSFREWEKVFDMAEFDLKETDENLFKSHQSMLSLNQLNEAIDSIEVRKTERKEQLLTQVSSYFYHARLARDTLSKKKRPDVDTTLLSEVPPAFIEMLNQGNIGMNLQKSLTLARNVKNYTLSIKDDIPRLDKSIAEHEIEIHRKFSWAIACIIFLFIGAPMGAIVRKGGFGWPILISIIFFVFYVMLTIVGEKIAKEMVVSAVAGMWMPCLILFPISIFLTYKAMNDSKAFSMETYKMFLQSLKKSVDKKTSTTQA